MKTLLALASLLLWSGTACADFAGAMAQCKSIADPQARVICYDAISIAMPEPTAPATSAPVAPTAVETPVPDEIKGRIAGEIGGWRLGTVIKLEDGSRWKVISDDRTGFKARTNPAVTLKRGYFNWWLSIDDSSFRTKVMELQQELPRK